MAMEYLSLSVIWFTPVFSEMVYLGTSKLYGIVESKSHGKMLCENDGRMLPVYDGEQHSTAILKALHDNNLTHAWLDLDLIAEHKWLFTDGRELGSNEAIYEAKGPCALLKKSHLTGVRCNTLADGFICEMKGCSSCDGFCMKSEADASMCLTFYRERSNWYAAITKCSLRGKTLSVQSVIHLRKALGTDEEAWIGLRQGLWKLHLPNNRSFPPKTNKWSFSAAEDKCASVYEVNEGLAWKPVPCDDKIPALCFEYSFIAPTGTIVLGRENMTSGISGTFVRESENTTSGAKGSTKDSLSTIAMVGFTFLSILVLVVVVFGILCIFSRKGFKRDVKVMYIVREEYVTTPPSFSSSCCTSSSERSHEGISFYAMARMPSDFGLQTAEMVEDAQFEDEPPKLPFRLHTPTASDMIKRKYSTLPDHPKEQTFTTRTNRTSI